MWPLSAPVLSHWAANCFWERLAIESVTAMLRGSVANAIPASNGLMENIMMSTPTTVKAAVVS